MVTLEYFSNYLHNWEKKVCRMVINSSSYKNLISEEAITKLNLKMESYRTLYIVKRLKKTNYVMVKKWC